MKSVVFLLKGTYLVIREVEIPCFIGQNQRLFFFDFKLRSEARPLGGTLLL